MPPWPRWTHDDGSNGSSFASVLPSAPLSKVQLSDCWPTLGFTVLNSVIGDVSQSTELHQGEVFDLFFKPRLPHHGRSSINHTRESRSRVEGSPPRKTVSSLLQRVKHQSRREIVSINHSSLRTPELILLTGSTSRCARLLKVCVMRNLPVASILLPSLDPHDIWCKQGTYGHE